MSDEERADAVRDAQAHLFDAIELLSQAVRGTRHEAHVDAYVISHLKILASTDHGYLSRDTNISDIIGWFEDEGNYEG